MNAPSDIPAYSVTVMEKNGVFYLSIPELHLYASGNDISQTYEEILRKQAETFNLADETDTLGELPLPSRERPKSISFEELLPFAVKTAIVAGIFGIVSLLVALQVETSLGRQVAKVDSMVESVSAPLGRISAVVDLIALPDSGTAAERLAVTLHRMADTFIAVTNAVHSIKPERQKELAIGMRRLVLALKPIVDEARLLVEKGDPAACAAAKGTPDCPPATKSR